MKEGDILLHKFSPTGFYSSAVRNPYLRALEARSERQIAFSTTATGDHQFLLDVGVGRKKYWVTRDDLLRAREWAALGNSEALKTPDNTLVFVTPEDKGVIRQDQSDCMGCLSQCGFSSWADSETNTTGRLADPRSFCIQKTLQDIAHGGDTEQNLMFGGPLGVSLRDRSVLFERVRPDRAPARRSDHDRRLTRLPFPHRK